MLLEQIQKNLNVAVYHSPVRTEMGIPCHFGPSSHQSGQACCPETYSNTAETASSLSSSILAPTAPVSICVRLFINRLLFFSRIRAPSQIHISSLLEVEQNFWLESSMLSCFQLKPEHSWNGCCPGFRRLLSLIRLNNRLIQQDRKKTLSEGNSQELKKIFEKD